MRGCVSSATAPRAPYRRVDSSLAKDDVPTPSWRTSIDTSIPSLSSFGKDFESKITRQHFGGGGGGGVAVWSMGTPPAATRAYEPPSLDQWLGRPFPGLRMPYLTC